MSRWIWAGETITERIRRYLWDRRQATARELADYFGADLGTCKTIRKRVLAQITTKPPISKHAQYMRKWREKKDTEELLADIYRIASKGIWDTTDDSQPLPQLDPLPDRSNPRVYELRYQGRPWRDGYSYGYGPQIIRQAEPAPSPIEPIVAEIIARFGTVDEVGLRQLVATHLADGLSEDDIIQWFMQRLAE